MLGEPERVPHTASNPWMLKLVDLDGDGADDLVILDGGTDHPIHVRFATDEKKLGPEQRFQVEAPRAIAFGQIDGKGGSEILTIENQSGRGKVLTLDESAADERNKRGRLIFFGLPQGSDRGRSLAVGDLDGDRQEGRRRHRPGQRPGLALPPERPARAWARASPSPACSAARTVRLADLDGDGKDEVYVLSEQEKQIGRSVLENGRLTFPTPAADHRRAGGDGRGRPRRRQDARGPLRRQDQVATGGDTFDLRALKREASGDVHAVRAGARPRRSTIAESLRRARRPSRASTSTATARPTS